MDLGSRKDEARISQLTRELHEVSGRREAAKKRLQTLMGEAKTENPPALVRLRKNVAEGVSWGAGAVVTTAGATGFAYLSLDALVPVGAGLDPLALWGIAATVAAAVVVAAHVIMQLTNRENRV